MPFGSRPAPDIVVGAGHNGLVAACYLARAGRDVVVLEALDRPGGGARTEQSVPGFRFDLHSVAHNIINMTDIPAELDLAGTGLVYREMDPFSIAVRPGAPTVRFYRSVERTVASIAEHDRRLADAYRSFVTDGTAILRTILPAMRGERATRDAWGIARGLAGIARAGPLRLARDLMAPYETTLRRRLGADWLAGPVAAFAAHGGVGPTAAGGSLYAYWQAAYHLFGQWHPNGGSQSLTDALVARLRSLGGQLRCAAPVEVIETTAGRVTGVRLAGGELVPAGTVTTAIDPKTALLELLRPALNGPAAADLEATRRSNVVQAVIHVATRSLPAYPDTRPGDWNGLQSYVDHVQHLSTAWTRAEAGILDDRPPLYAFTPSAIDNSLASPDSTPSTSPALPPLPASTAGGTPTPSGSSNAASAPSKNVPLASATTSSTSPSARPTPWKPNAGPAPTPCTSTSAGTRSASSAPPLPRPTGAPPITDLSITGAGTNPTGGIAGTPGRQGALTLLADHRH